MFQLLRRRFRPPPPNRQYFKLSAPVDQPELIKVRAKIVDFQIVKVFFPSL